MSLNSSKSPTDRLMPVVRSDAKSAHPYYTSHTITVNPESIYLEALCETISDAQIARGTMKLTAVDDAGARLIVFLL
jgi:hypothetical protein